LKYYWIFYIEECHRGWNIVVKGEMQSTYGIIYMVFHDLWTILQEMISQVVVIKKVHINMCLVLDVYGVMTA